MTIEPDHLITFSRVAQEGSLTRAAQRLHRTQPAISAQLKRLSEAVGEPLYRRHRHGVTLTPAGQALLPYAQALTRALEGASGLVSGLQGATRGTLRVAASMTVAVYLLPSILARFHEHRPELDLHLLTRNSSDTMALLQSGKADLSFVEGPVEEVPLDLEQRRFFHDEIVLVVRPNHPLAQRPRVSPADLEGLGIVQREAGSGTREVVERAFINLNLNVRIVLEATGLEAVKEAVLQGFGPGFLSRLAVKREVKGGLLVAVPIDAQGFTRPMTLLHPKLELCSQATRVLLEFLGASGSSSV